MADNEPITDLDEELQALLENATPVKGRVSKNLRIVYSIRLSPQELDDFSSAAKSRGMTVSDLMRSATLAAIQANIDLDKASALGDVKEKARELNEAIDRLTA